MDNEKLFKRVLGRKIREKRNIKGMTLEFLAEQVKMNGKHLGRIERGEKLPNSYTLTLLQIALDINSDEYINEFLEKEKQKDN